MRSIHVFPNGPWEIGLVGRRRSSSGDQRRHQFGFETARQVGVGIIRNLAEDARTTSRWYLIISMGRAAGHLALGIGKAAA
ncbi:MAG: hypothetical protein ACRELF_15870, partial [Gemmataceae bacterium]